jgi:hypothetical protein
MRYLRDRGDAPVGAEQADQSANPREVLELVDRQLEAHDLEIVLYDTEEDCYKWAIRGRLGK